MDNKSTKKGCGMPATIIASLFILALLIFLFKPASSGGGSSTTPEGESRTATAVKYTPEQKDSIKAVEKAIEDSLKIVKEENLAKAKESLKSFRVSKDEFNNTAFYYDKRTPRYVNENFIFPYIGEQDGRYWLRFQLQYESDEWLFIRNATIRVDSVNYPVYCDWKTDHDTRIWEWCDMQVTESDLKMLHEIANGKSVKIRYNGQQYYDDRTITSKEKDIIKKTLDIYEKLK